MQSFIVVPVVVPYMPSFSATINDEQYQYLLSTKDNEESKSERLRELVDKGIAEETDE